ncbi:hypothetical protein MBLNU459_g1477t1 [Dothideomycetes sp. NU459]
MTRREGNESRISVVDFARWNDQNPIEQRKISRELVAACHGVGFVYITNHGISEELSNEAFHWSKKLFDLSHEEKMLAPHPDGPAVHRGYSYPGLEKVSQVYGEEAESGAVGEKLRKVKDCKESYEIGSEDNAAQPNVWLPESVLPGFREFTTTFYWKCNEVAQVLLKAIAIGLGLDSPEYLLNFHTGHENQLRLLHYPPIAADELESKRSARMPAHSDWGIVTLLFQDDCGGLQIEDPLQKDRFQAAPPMKGALVMNIGDLLMRWSNDYLKSTLHRVALPPLANRFEGAERITRERYSIPYFVSARMDSVIECLPACKSPSNPAKYGPIETGEYMKMRGKLQYRSADETATAAG